MVVNALASVWWSCSIGSEEACQRKWNWIHIRFNKSVIHYELLRNHVSVRRVEFHPLPPPSLPLPLPLPLPLFPSFLPCFLHPSTSPTAFIPLSLSLSLSFSLSLRPLVAILLIGGGEGGRQRGGVRMLMFVKCFKGMEMCSRSRSERGWC